MMIRHAELLRNDSLPARKAVLTERFGRYRKAFVFGTGGGNDIFSATLVAMQLRAIGISVDVGGVLNPAYSHIFNGLPERPVNSVSRDIIMLSSEKKLDYIIIPDPFIPKITADAGLDIGRFYDLSIRFGTSPLLADFSRLVSENRYDLIVGVDVGGDILARGRLDPTMTTPLMDSASLYLLGNVKIDSALFVFGMGTDAELRINNVKSVLRELEREDLLLCSFQTQRDEPEVICFRAMYEEVRRLRRGKTILNFFKTLDTKTPGQDIEYDQTAAAVGDESHGHYVFRHALWHRTFGMFYVFDAKRLFRYRSSITFKYNNPLEHYVKTKNIPQWKTELDGYCLWSGNNWTSAEHEGRCMVMLCLSTLTPDPLRTNVLRHYIASLKAGRYEVALMLRKDLPLITAEGLAHIPAGRFSIVSSKQNDISLLKTIARQVSDYCRK